MQLCIYTTPYLYLHLEKSLAILNIYLHRCAENIISCKTHISIRQNKCANFNCKQAIYFAIQMYEQMFEKIDLVKVK